MFLEAEAKQIVDLYHYHAVDGPLDVQHQHAGVEATLAVLQLLCQESL